MTVLSRRPVMMDVSGLAEVRRVSLLAHGDLATLFTNYQLRLCQHGSYICILILLKLPATEVDLSQEHLFINFWDCEFLGLLNTDVSASSGFTDDWSCRVWSPHTGGGMRKVSRALQVMQAMQFLWSAVGDYISFSNIKKSLCLAFNW